jgi:hypothetical protein
VSDFVLHAAKQNGQAVLAGYFAPDRCQDRPRTINRRAVGSLPDMRAKYQTALSE